MRPLRTATVAALALLAGGCDWPAAGRPVAPRGDEPRLSRTAFTTRANAICARRARALAALGRPPRGARAAAFFARVAEFERAEAERLAALRPPSDLDRDFARLALASGELAVGAARFHAAVVADDAHERRRALADADRVATAYDRAARRLGLTCRQTA
jgi:hypothetical protein